MNPEDLWADQVFLDLVGEFVDVLPERIEEIRQAASLSDWTTVTSLAHQLKGSGGGFGFSEVSTTAAVVESLCRVENPEPSILQEKIELLSDACRQTKKQLEEYRCSV